MIENRSRLFLASFIALIAVAMPFAIRVDILSALGREFNLSHQQQGLIYMVVSWGYPVTIMVVGPLCDLLGMGRLLRLAAIGHVAGIGLTIISPKFGFPVLLASTLLIGLSDGVVEAVISPLVATLYPRDKTGRISILHAAWPVGLIVGGGGCLIISALMNLDASGVTGAVLSLSWKAKMALALIPPVVYGFLTLGQKFPQTERAAAGVSTSAMLREALRPGFLLLLVCFVFTAMTEGGPDQWVGSAMKDMIGIRGIVFLMYMSVIMFVLRIFGGTLARVFAPFGLLAGSCVLAAVGLLWLSRATTPLVAVGAVTLFGVGKTCLWPTLLGITSERYPRGGSFLLALLAGVGMIAVGFAGPMLGHVYDRYTIRNLPAPLAETVVVDGHYSPAAVQALEDPADLAAVHEAEKEGAAMVFCWAAAAPLFPLVVFVVLGLYWRPPPSSKRNLRRGTRPGTA